jgi:very-short-patch-repair endonuclease
MANYRIIHYDPWLKEKARWLRNNSTLGEILLWNELKRKKMRGLDFHRQKPIGRYIVDFYCPALSLAIEVDGSIHSGREDRDEERQRWIESQGITVLRYDDLSVRLEMGVVLGRLENWIDSWIQTHPPPPPAEDPSKGGDQGPR